MKATVNKREGENRMEVVLRRSETLEKAGQGVRAFLRVGKT